MSHALHVAATVTVAEQAAFALAKTYNVDTLSITEYTAAAGAVDDEVEICGASALGNVKFMFIYAASYPLSGATRQLTYKVNANTENAIPMEMFHLWNEHMLVGLDTAGLLPDSIFVSNASAGDVDMVIVVGKNNV